MPDLFETLQEIGFSINEAKVYVALVAKNPMSGYEVAKQSNITRTMVYDILNRLVQKGIVITLENEPRLYSPVPYKELFKRFREDYNSRLEVLETALDQMESQQKSDNYIKNIADYDAMIQEVKNLIRSARSEIYISVWEEEARLFAEDLREVHGKGVNIITFSFSTLPYDFGTVYSYNIASDELGKMWTRRRIIVVVDRERIIIGEGNDKIEEISMITSNTMLVELAIDQMLLDIIHLLELRRGGFLPQEGRTVSVAQHREATERFQMLLGLDAAKVPKRVDQD